MAMIDTDAAIGTILSHFDSDTIRHVIEDSLEIDRRFRPYNTPMANYVDVINRHLLATLQNAPDYRDKVNTVRIETMQEIILLICKYYNLRFCQPFEEIAPEELYGIARIMYEVFVSSFSQYAINFFTSYIIRNAEYINQSLEADPNVNHPKGVGVYDEKNFTDPKFILIHANINKVIYDIAGHDISLDLLLSYFLDPVTYRRLGSLLQDCGDIYKNYYAILIRDQRYVSGVLTNVKLQLQSMTYATQMIDVIQQ